MAAVAELGSLGGNHTHLHGDYAMQTRLIACLLSGLVLFSLPGRTLAQATPDLNDHWAQFQRGPMESIASTSGNGLEIEITTPP